MPMEYPVQRLELSDVVLIDLDVQQAKVERLCRAALSVLYH
jgi:hypothetical protein